MATPSDHTQELTSLFETITGQSTVTEKQQNEHPARFIEQVEENSIATYVDTVVRDDGLDDAVQDPEQN